MVAAVRVGLSGGSSPCGLPVAQDAGVHVSPPAEPVSTVPRTDASDSRETSTPGISSRCPAPEGGSRTVGATTTVAPVLVLGTSVPTPPWSATCRPSAAWRRTRYARDGDDPGRPPVTAGCSGSSPTRTRDRSGTCRSSPACFGLGACPTRALGRPWAQATTHRHPQPRPRRPARSRRPPWARRGPSLHRATLTSRRTGRGRTPPAKPRQAATIRREPAPRRREPRAAGGRRFRRGCPDLPRTRQHRRGGRGARCRCLLAGRARHAAVRRSGRWRR